MKRAWLLACAALAVTACVSRGGYVLYDPPGGFQAILMATGSEVHLALDSAKKLLARYGLSFG